MDAAVQPIQTGYNMTYCELCLTKRVLVESLKSLEVLDWAPTQNGLFRLSPQNDTHSNLAQYMPASKKS